MDGQRPSYGLIHWQNRPSRKGRFGAGAGALAFFIMALSAIGLLLLFAAEIGRVGRAETHALPDAREGLTRTQHGPLRTNPPEMRGLIDPATDQAAGTVH